MTAELKFTPGVRELFLQTFRDTGNVRMACEAAGVSRSTVDKHRKENPAFAEAFADAEEDFADNLEDAAYKRAVEGVLEPVFHKGEICGEVAKYSDTLLLALLKARRPAKFRDNQKIELDAKVDANVTDERKRASRIAGLLSLARNRRDNDDLA